MNLLKPNIRGVARRNLRWRLGGWQYPDGNGREWLIEFNLPWRRNWTQRYHQALLRARSGDIYVVRSLESDKPIHRPPKKMLYFVATLTTLVITALVPLQFAVDGKQQAKKIPHPGAASPKNICASFLETPNEFITTWLAKQPSEITFVAKHELELGGVRNLKVKATCAGLETSWAVQLFKSGDTWKLNKTSRLEN